MAALEAPTAAVMLVVGALGHGVQARGSSASWAALVKSRCELEAAV